MRKLSKKTSKKKPKSEARKVYRINWLSAAPFLLRGFQLLDVKTTKKGDMVAFLSAK